MVDADGRTQERKLAEENEVVAALKDEQDYDIILHGDVWDDEVQVTVRGETYRCLAYRAWERLLERTFTGKGDSVPLLHGATLYAPRKLITGD